MSLTEKRKIMEQSSKVKSIIEWCNDQHEKNGTVRLVWDGGGDNGWVHMTVDGDDIDNEYTQALVDRMYDVLDYGSWAGEFSANGEAIYDPTTSTFSGIDSYSEEESDIMDVNITITVPKSLWFDNLNIECEAYYYDEPSVVPRFIIKNGFLTDEHSSYCNDLKEVLETELSDRFEAYKGDEGNSEFSSCTDQWILNRTDAVEDGDNLVFYIKRINIQVRDESENYVMLELDKETVAAIDKQLNSGSHERD